MKRRLQLYPRGRGLLLPSLARPHCRCPLGPVTLYQEVAAAASLALVCMSFPLVPWATFFSGCLGNQPLLLEGEEGPKSGKKKKKRQPLFAGRSLRMSSRPAHLFPFWRGNPWEFPFLLLPGWVVPVLSLLLLLSCSVVSDSFATPWTVALQVPPLSMGFPREEYWRRLPFPPPGDLPNSGMEPASPALIGRWIL